MKKLGILLLGALLSCCGGSSGNGNSSDKDGGNDRGKQVRDAFGEFPNQRRSSNFVVKWGDDGKWTERDAKRILVSFEQAWQKLVEEMEFPAPEESNQYLFNVYISKTGGRVPLKYGPEVPTYVASDDEGFQYVVMNPERYNFNDKINTEFTDFAVAHEFVHALQLASRAYDQSTNLPAYWYWEATADWAAEQVQPNSVAVGEYAGAYLLYPHVALDFFVEDPLNFQDTIMLNVHHYGAHLYLRYLSEHVADWRLIRDSWAQAQAQSDPIEVLNSLLEGHNLTVASSFVDYASRNVAWDYKNGEQYRGWWSSYREHFSAEDFSFVVNLGSFGTSGFVNPPDSRLPQAYGYNVIKLSNPAAGTLRVEVIGENTGTMGSESVLEAMLVRHFSDRVEYVELNKTDTSLQIAIPGIGKEKALSLVVVAVPESGKKGEVFPYGYSMSIAN